MTMRLNLFSSNLKFALVLFVLGAGRLYGAASSDDPATMLRTAVDEVLSIAYSGQGR